MGLKNQLPDALSRQHSPGPPGKDVNDAFPDNESESDSLAKREQQGVSIDGVHLNDLIPTPLESVHPEAVKTLVTPLHSPFDSNLTAPSVCGFRACVPLTLLSLAASEIELFD